ncbi:Hypothetical predicted protein [Paramuricea clavata]|uniref:Uncharacterized protein n=1 Tax=Paramuricea clavata TaxID=317549 RepID=A0A7D9IM75_PARCT|nr:Hypothetical predicted protein [Paramuricea clavata]
MNKLHMGPSPAVSRYHQQHRFHIQNDTPNLWDHDFPHPGYLITTSGYQMQVKQSVRDDQHTNEQDKIYTRVDLNDYSKDPDFVNFQERTHTIESTEDEVVPNDKYKDKLGRPPMVPLCWF